MVLFINSCVREKSRTFELAAHLLAHLHDEPILERRLSDIDFPPIDEAYLVQRDANLNAANLDDPMFQFANEFASADTIVIAAPYWDLSFPSMLKRYLELVNVVGVTFRYSESGCPEGLCKAKRLFYVSTAGGDLCPEEYGFGYVAALCKEFYGIGEIKSFMAKGLDIYGRSPQKILEDAKREIDEYFAGLSRTL